MDNEHQHPTAWRKGCDVLRLTGDSVVLTCRQGIYLNESFKPLAAILYFRDENKF